MLNKKQLWEQKVAKLYYWKIIFFFTEFWKAENSRETFILPNPSILSQEAKLGLR